MPSASLGAKKPHWNTARRDGLKRVHWTPGEVDLLVTASARAVYEGKATSPLKALRIAQEGLPADRRRKVDTLAGIEWFVPRMSEARHALAQADVERLAKEKAEAERQAKIEAEADRIGGALKSGAYVSEGVDGVVGQLRGLIVKEMASLLVEALVEAARQLRSSAANEQVLTPLVAAIRKQAGD